MRKNVFGLIAVVALSLMHIACSDKDKTAGGVVEDQGVVAIVDKTVAGVSQKGPFVNGSSILLFEMDGNYAQTGKSFPGNISSNKGDFSLRNVSLVSQYATLVANGYYKNEVTGKTSSGTIQLNAITDLSARSYVNVNLLTHLEYRRVLTLLDSGLAMSQAKKQAETEIFKFLGFDENTVGNDAENFEDLDIFNSGEGDAALLAISILTQGDLVEGDLTERLTEVSEGLTDAKWNGDSLKTVMADWAVDAPLAKIRGNVVDWKFSDKVPDFEKFVKRFWWNNYGLGNCGSNNKNDSAFNANKLSRLYEKKFVCDGNDWNLQYDVSSKTILNTWNGKNGSKNIYVNGERFSNWYSVTDLQYPAGSTEFIFGMGSGADSVISSEKIAACGGHCGTVIFSGWKDDEHSYLNWGITGFWLDTDNVGVDASEWNGLCVTYQKSTDGVMYLYLDTDHEDDSDKLQYAFMPAGQPTTVNISWDDFSQEGWGVPLDVHELVKNLVHVNFIFKAEPNTAIKFNILEVGPYGKCSGDVESHFDVEKTFEPWTAEKGTRVMTDLITDTVAVSWAGKWYAWTDGNDGSSTILNLGPDDDNPIPTIKDDRVQDEVIKKCEGLCGHIYFGDSLRISDGKGYDAAPWAVEKVSLVQDDVHGENAFGWFGLCMEYVSDVDIQMTVVSDVKDGGEGWVKFIAPKSKEKTVIDMLWSGFKQMDYAKKKISVEEYIRTLKALFIFQYGKPFDEAYFNITKLGAYGTCGIAYNQN